MKFNHPGTGAVVFARQFVVSISETESLPVIKQLIKGELHDSSDKRVKRCGYCGYYYRDRTRPNNSRTCSGECKVALDTFNRAKKRADASLLKPKKQTKRELHYAYWLEYPFWSPEYEMLKQSWRYEPPYSPTKLAQIAAAKERDARMGGKRKPKRVVPYNGDEAETGKVSVKFTKSDRKPGEIKTWKMKPEEVPKYFSSRYSDRQLKLERKRAELFSHSKKV